MDGVCSVSAWTRLTMPLMRPLCVSAWSHRSTLNTECSLINDDNPSMNNREGCEGSTVLVMVAASDDSDVFDVGYSNVFPLLPKDTAVLTVGGVIQRSLCDV